MSIVVPTFSILGQPGGIQSSKSLAGDPLAGLPWFNRWQTRAPGSNALLGNLFQDAALTVPATTEGDTILGVDGVFSISGAMTQSDVAQKQTLHFDTGCPTISFFGTGNFNLPDASALTQGELFFLFKPTSRTQNDNIYLMGDGGGSATYLPFSGDGNLYDGFGSLIRHGPFAGSIPAGWVTYNASSVIGDWRNAINGVEIFSTAVNTIFFSASPQFGATDNNHWILGGTVIAVFIFSQKLTAPQRALVNSYLTSLIP